MTSPYIDLPVEEWQRKTLELIHAHPLDTNVLYEVVLTVWKEIFRSQIGSKPFRIGVDLFPAPQVMGFFLHELIPLELEYRFPAFWRRDKASSEKDLVYLPDNQYSVEIKTSSSGKSIYGNRSYAQIGTTTKKEKSGYYLAINFEKFNPQIPHPSITLVRFGWLDHEDWLGQSSTTGQQARLAPAVERFKLLKLPLEEK